MSDGNDPGGGAEQAESTRSTSRRTPDDWSWLLILFVVVLVLGLLIAAYVSWYNSLFDTPWTAIARFP